MFANRGGLRLQVRTYQHAVIPDNKGDGIPTDKRVTYKHHVLLYEYFSRLVYIPRFHTRLLFFALLGRTFFEQERN